MLSRSMQQRLKLHLKLQSRLLDQQQVVLQKKRAALEQELTVSDLLEELVSDADLKLAAGTNASGLSLHNNGQFKISAF